MLGTTRGKLLNQYTPDYVLYDLETTGIKMKRNRRQRQNE